MNISFLLYILFAKYKQKKLKLKLKKKIIKQFFIMPIKYNILVIKDSSVINHGKN